MEYINYYVDLEECPICGCYRNIKTCKCVECGAKTQDDQCIYYY